MNKLKKEKQAQVIAALVEGNSIRSIERMFGVHRDTIMRLSVRIGEACRAMMDDVMRDLSCKRIQMDEIWGFINKKQRHLKPGDDPRENGDVWTFVAIDADTKLIPAFRVGKRNLPTAQAFLMDVASRMVSRVQISSDALSAYKDSVEQAFGADADYGQIVKSYEAEPVGPGRYSPPHVTDVKRIPISGAPDVAHISTSYVERQNLTMRMSIRRLTRLTNAFSKKRENFEAAVAVHFAHYNFCRIHQTLKVTPAMEAGITDHVWSIEDLVDLQD